MIDKINKQFITTQSTIYDTGSLTTLESIGKFLEKLNELVEQINLYDIKLDYIENVKLIEEVENEYNRILTDGTLSAFLKNNIDTSVSNNLTEMLNDGSLANLKIENNSIEGTKIKQNSITSAKVNFLQETNLYIDKNSTTNKIISINTGEWVDFEGVTQTELIENKNYKYVDVFNVTPSRNYNVTFFDKDKNFINGVSIITTNSGTYSIKLEENIGYFAITILNSERSKVKIYSTDSILDKNIKIGKENITFNTVNDLFNTDIFRNNLIAEITYGGFYHAETLEWVPNSGAGLSNFIDCKEGESFTILNMTEPVHHLIFKDKEGNLKKGVRISNTKNYSFIVDDNTIKFAISVSKNENIKVENGSKLEMIPQLKSLIYKSMKKSSGKKFSIIGDSLSTFKDWIPKGNAVFYTGSNCGINNVTQMWWYYLINDLDMELIVNNSWSGSRVTSTKGNENEWGCGSRSKSLHTQEKTPDIIFVEMGTNDMHHEIELGNYDGHGEIPQDTTIFSNAYSLMLKNIMESYPLAKVYCLTLPMFEYNGGIGFPDTNENGNILPDYNDVIRKIAHLFGAEIIEVCNSGITYFNRQQLHGDYGTYSENSQYSLHWNKLGQKIVGEYVEKCID